MEIFKIIGFSLVCIVLILVLKQIKPEFALLVQVLSGVIIILFLLPKVNRILDALERLALVAQLNQGFMGILLKIVGISLVAEFGIAFCRDSGQQAMATKVELSAKILILFVALPIVFNVLEMLEQILR